MCQYAQNSANVCHQTSCNITRALTVLPLFLVALAGSFELVHSALATGPRALCVQGLLQAHTERLEQQNQAHVQQLLAQHASELHSGTAALTAQLQQQLHTDVQRAASKHAADVTQRQQLVERSDALLAVEKQKTSALKVGQNDVNAQCNKMQIRSLKPLLWSCVCDRRFKISCMYVECRLWSLVSLHS